MGITKLSIADFNIAVDCDIPRFALPLKTFINDFEKPDFVFNISYEDVETEKSMNTEIPITYTSTFARGAAFRKLAELLPKRNSFVLHGASFEVSGVGVVLGAHSGTGKSTHMFLWQDLLGDKMTVVNGDKPIMRIFDDGDTLPDGILPNMPYIYGTPWRGKEGLGCNMRTPLKHICFIERSETNFVEKISPSDAIGRIFNQVYMPKDQVALANTMQLINRLINSCELWIIHCNMDISAAETAYSAIFGK